MFENNIDSNAAGRAAQATALLNEGVQGAFGAQQKVKISRAGDSDSDIKPEDLARDIPFDQILHKNFHGGHNGHPFDPLGINDDKLTKDDLRTALRDGWLSEREANAVSFALGHFRGISHVHTDPDSFYHEGGIEKADLKKLPDVLFGKSEAARMAEQEGYVERSGWRFDVALGLGAVTVGTLALLARYPAVGLTVAAVEGGSALIVPFLAAGGIAVGSHFLGLDRLVGNASYYALQKPRMAFLKHAF